MILTTPVLSPISYPTFEMKHIPVSPSYFHPATWDKINVSYPTSCFDFKIHPASGQTNVGPSRQLTDCQHWPKHWGQLVWITFVTLSYSSLISQGENVLRLHFKQNIISHFQEGCFLPRILPLSRLCSWVENIPLPLPY